MLRRALKLFGRSEEEHEPEPPSRAAMVLSGGGARAAYQAGVVSYMAEELPDAHFPILNGVSAGAINAAHLANHPASFQHAAERLVDCWRDLSTDKVFRARSGMKMLWNFLRHAAQEGDGPEGEEWHALLDTAPLRDFLKEKLHTSDGVLRGVAENMDEDNLRAFSVVTTNYTTGQTVTWVQGNDIRMWERPNRVSRNAQLTVDHVMASTALPLLFPAVRLDGAWYGDGGIRLDAPLAPAIHLGADRIFVVSTRYGRSREEAERPAVHGYPPPAQIIGLLANALFLDVLDQDAEMMQRINRLAEQLPPEKRGSVRPIRMLVVRPSVDLGKLSGEYESSLPASYRFVARGLGTRETESPDWLSMLLFENDYIDRLLEIGYQDARRQHDEIETFLHGDAPS